MLINNQRLKLVSEESDAIFGTSNMICGSSCLTALLRAVIIRHTDWTVDSISNGSKVASTSVSSDSESIGLFKYNEYAIIIGETRCGYFPTSLECEQWDALDSAPYPISRYMSQFTKTRIFVNSKLHRVVAFVERQCSNKWLQALMSVFPRLLPWYFTQDLLEEEQEFFKKISVTPKSSGDSDEAVEIFEKYVNESADMIDFRDILLHHYLDDYQRQIADSQKRNYQSQIERIMYDIKTERDRLNNLYESFDSNTRLLNALETQDVEDSNEVYEFFKTHKCLDISYVDGRNILFGVTETLEYFDDEEFSRMCDNPSSYIHGYVNGKLLEALKEIFIERKAAFVVNAVFNLKSMRYVSMKENKLTNESVMPHPHIYYFGCGGGNDQYYSKYAEEGEWQLGIEQAISAVKNINFGDSTVIGRMLSWIDNHKSAKCIKMPNSDNLICMNEYMKLMERGNNG